MHPAGRPRGLRAVFRLAGLAEGWYCVSCVMPLAKRLYGTLGQVWRLVQMCFDVMLVAAEPTALLIDCIGSLASRSAHMARLRGMQ